MALDNARPSYPDGPKRSSGKVVTCLVHRNQAALLASARAQTPLTTKASTSGVFQYAPQSHVVEVAAQTERKTVGLREERLYGPRPAHDAA